MYLVFFRVWILGYIVICEFQKSGWPDSYYCAPGQQKLWAKNDFQIFWIFRGYIPAFLSAIVEYTENGVILVGNRLLCRHCQWQKYKTGISVLLRVWRTQPSIVLIPWVKRWRHRSGQFAKKYKISNLVQYLGPVMKESVPMKRKCDYGTGKLPPTPLLP